MIMKYQICTASNTLERYKQDRIGILTAGGDCPGLNAAIRGGKDSCRQYE